VSERGAFVDARRAEFRNRDASRYRLADELAQRAAFSIPPDQGFAVVPAGSLTKVDEVVRDANQLIERIGHKKLTEGKLKGGFMAKGFLPDSAFSLDSPYFRLGLSEEVIAPIAAYLGFVPVLTEIDVWYSVPGHEAPRSSQLWHLDYADTTQVKVFVHLNDIGAEMGPLTALSAASSEQLAKEADYNLGEKVRVPDEALARHASPEQLVSFEGPTGTADFVDSSRCFHMGSRVGPGAEPRRLAFFQYLTPYNFEYREGPAGESAYGWLATAGSSELERLVLGAA